MEKNREKLSVIIPTLNEAQRLGGLLEALHAQTHPPDEIIVADAGSKDGTRELAQALGVRVVPGGMPAVGRNAGARAASGDLLLFLDADVLPGPGFIAGALDEFQAGGFGVATTLIETLEDDPSMRILAEATNLFLLVVQRFVPHAPGFCILVRRRVHAATGGFDESAILAEDHAYVNRAARRAPFGVLTSVRIPVSMRRLEKEGLVKLALKYLWAEMHALAGKPVYSLPFKYEFGTHGLAESRAKPRWRIVDLEPLRAQVEALENPLPRLSAQGRDWLASVVSLDRRGVLRERLRLPLDRRDLNRLQRYISRRLALTFQEGGLRWQGGREEPAAPLTEDCIEMTDPNWLDSTEAGEVPPGKEIP